MATLTVWKFHSADGAGQAVQKLAQLQQQELIKVHDAAIVEWPEGKKKPKTRQLQNLAGVGAMSGAFWGFLFGLIFLVPLLGMAVGAASGALTGSLADVGIDDRFINEVRSKVTPGTSAMFVMTSGAVVDKVSEAFQGVDMELLQTNLSGDQEEQLRDAFGHEE